jgi:hypothetical protein
MYNIYCGIWFTKLLLYIIVLTSIYKYMNNLNNECECNMVRHTLITYINSYISIIGTLVIIQLIYIVVSKDSFSNVFYIVLESLINIINLFVFSYLLKYIFDIENKCKCGHINPNIHLGLKILFSVVIVIALINTIIYIVQFTRNCSYRKQSTTEIHKIIQRKYAIQKAYSIRN